MYPNLIELNTLIYVLCLAIGYVIALVFAGQRVWVGVETQAKRKIWLEMKNQTRRFVPQFL